MGAQQDGYAEVKTEVNPDINADIKMTSTSLQEIGFAVAKSCPELLDLIVSHLLADLAIALQTDDQTDPVRELLEVLMEGHTLRSPIVAAVMAEPLNGGVDQRISRVRRSGARWIRQGHSP